MRGLYLRLLVPCVVMLMAVAASPGVSSAEKKAPKELEIKGCKKKKGPVKFKHAAHEKAVKKMGKDCKACHHTGPVEKLCSDCHKKAEGKVGTCDDKSATKNPYHVQCRTCHKEAAKEPHKMTKGPTTKCKGCHVGDKDDKDDKEAKEK